MHIINQVTDLQNQIVVKGVLKPTHCRVKIPNLCIASLTDRFYLYFYLEGSALFKNDSILTHTGYEDLLYALISAQLMLIKCCRLHSY